MFVVDEFQRFLRDVFSSAEREDVAFLERSWDTFESLYLHVLDNIAALMGVLGKNKSQQQSFAQLVQIGEIVAYYLKSSKYLLDNGFLFQAAAMLRPGMETGLKLAIVVCLGKLQDWLEGRKIRVLVKSHQGKLRRKAIDECTYGALVDSLSILVDALHNEALATLCLPIRDLEVIEMLSSILEIHQKFRRSLDTR